jgi:5-methylcytosine-specific restriction endonuclease McrA
MDHIVPLIESNGNLKFWKMGNLQTLCKSCHTTKTSSEATERASKRRILKEKKSKR